MHDVNDNYTHILISTSNLIMISFTSERVASNQLLVDLKRINFYFKREKPFRVIQESCSAGWAGEGVDPRANL